MTRVFIRESDGNLRTMPSNATIIEADGGVYISYDIDASRTEFSFEEGAEIVGLCYGDLDLIEDPTEGDNWFTTAMRDYS